MPARNTIEIVIAATDQASGILGGISEGVRSLGSGITRAGATMTAVTAPIAVGLGIAVHSAMDFGSSLTNISSVTGTTGAELVALGDQIAAIGDNSIYGGQVAVDTFYDIAGSVTDAASRMPILEAAIATATAGQADLAATTRVLTGTMNAYGMSADQATRVSDILTRTVALGAASMDEFASALPQVIGTAAAMNIEFEEVAGAMAFITTRGISAAQAGTMLDNAMNTLLAPTGDLAALIESLGYESGQAMVDTLGLAGAYQALAEANGGSLAGIITNQTALAASFQLTDAAFNDFMDTFVNGVTDATSAAAAIQLADPAMQMQLLQSSMEGITREVGEALIPALLSIIGAVRPVLTSIISWIRANPQLTGAIAGIAAAAVALGPILMAIGGTISFLGSSMALPLVALAGLAAAFVTNFGGIQDAVMPIVEMVGNALGQLMRGIGFFAADLQEFGLMDAIMAAFGMGQAADEMGGESWVAGIIMKFGVARDQAYVIVEGIGNAFQGLVSFIGGTVLPGLQQFANWFIVDALPAVISFVQTTVIPGIQALFTFLQNAWATVQPGLTALFDWFVTTALPAVVAFVTDTVIPGLQQFADFLINLWTTVSPGLLQFADWFLTSAMPAIVTFVTETALPAIQNLANFLLGIWEFVSPGLIAVGDWFVNTVLPDIISFVENTVMPLFQSFIDLIAGIWTAIQPALQSLSDGFTTTFGTLQGIVQPFLDLLGSIGQTVTNVTSAVTGAVSGGMNAVTATLGGSTNSGIAKSRDGGGKGRAGEAYIINPSAGPEAFIPTTSGTFIPNIDQLGGGAQNTYNLSVQVSGAMVADQQTTQQNADTLGNAIMAKLRERG